MFGLLKRKDPIEEALAIAAAFEEALARIPAASISNEAELSHPRATIRNALLLLICEEAQAARRPELVNALFTLASFQRMSAREEALVKRRGQIMAAAAAEPGRMNAAEFELQMLEKEAGPLFGRLEMAYEMDVERYEQYLADLGFGAHNDNDQPVTAEKRTC